MSIFYITVRLWIFLFQWFATTAVFVLFYIQIVPIRLWVAPALGHSRVLQTHSLSCYQPPPHLCQQRIFSSLCPHLKAAFSPRGPDSFGGEQYWGSEAWLLQVLIITGESLHPAPLSGHRWGHTHTRTGFKLWVDIIRIHNSFFLDFTCVPLFSYNETLQIEHIYLCNWSY